MPTNPGLTFRNSRSANAAGRESSPGNRVGSATSAASPLMATGWRTLRVEWVEPRPHHRFDARLGRAWQHAPALRGSTPVAEPPLWSDTR